MRKENILRLISFFNSNKIRKQEALTDDNDHLKNWEIDLFYRQNILWWIRKQ